MLHPSLDPRLTAQAPNNCNCNEPITVDDFSSTLTVLIAQNGLPANQVSNRCFRVLNTLIINQNYTFSNCEFIMLPGSRIEVLPTRRLTINNSSLLHGCSRMWRGIVLNAGNAIAGTDGGIIDFESSVIRDAENAVTASHFSRIRFVNNRFTNNYIGLRTLSNANLQFVQTLNNTPGDLTGNIFQFDPAFPYLPYVNVTDPVVNRPLAGIQLESTIFLFFGNNAGGNRNQIRGTRWGIRAFACTGIGLESFDINALSGAGSAGVISPVQQSNTGIFIQSSLDMNVRFNNIMQVRNGVVAFRNGNGRVYFDNDIQAETFGIFETVNSGTSWGQQNTISAATCIREGGFIAQFNQMTNQWNGSVDFSDNDLTTSRDFGILYESNSGLFLMRFNRITSSYSLENRAVGIMLRNCGINATGRVWENRITLPTVGPRFSTGIASQNMFATRIQDNLVKGNTSGGQNFTIGNGIQQFNSGRMRYCCNTLDNTSNGFGFNLANPNLGWFTTSFNRHSSGLTFGGNATISQQLNTGNNWTNAVTSIDALYPASTAVATSNAPLRMAPTLIPNMLALPMGWIIFAGNNDAVCSPATCNETNPANDPDPTTLTGFDMLAFVPGSTNAAYVQRSNHQSFLYQRLSSNSNLLGQNAQVDQFYANAQSGYIGALHNLKANWLNQFGIPTNLATAFQTAQSNLDAGFVTGQSLFAAYLAAPTPAAKQQALIGL
jgi:hypothetical protein